MRRIVDINAILNTKNIEYGNRVVGGKIPLKAKCSVDTFLHRFCYSELSLNSTNGTHFSPFTHFVAGSSTGFTSLGVAIRFELLKASFPLFSEFHLSVSFEFESK